MRRDSLRLLQSGFTYQRIIINDSNLAISTGIAFQVATKPAPSQPKPLIHCPKVLEMRHIVQFGSLDTEERRRMIEGIEKYRKFVIEQYEKEVGLLSIDPRSDAEKEKATELFEKVNNW